jgi:hypothetical protein
MAETGQVKSCVRDRAGAEVQADGAAGTPTRRRRPGPRSHERRSYEAKATLILTLCRRLEAGMSMAEACRCPTLPSRATMNYWLETHPEFRRSADAAIAAAERAFGPGRRPVHRWNWRLARRVLSRIEDGETLEAICADRSLPAFSTVQAWIRKRPDFRAAYHRAREAQADRLFDLAWRIACEADEAAVKTARLKIQTLKWRVAKLAPRSYGGLKAQEPAAGAATGGEGASGEGEGGAPRIVFHARRFAVTPDNRVVELTLAARGMTEEQMTDLRAAVMRGEVTEADVEQMTLAAIRRLEGRSAGGA